MKQNLTTKPAIDAYNAAVTKAYFRTLEYAKEMIATLHPYEARCSLEFEESNSDAIFKTHQFVSPVLFLDLHWDLITLQIHFGYECFDTNSELADFSSEFVRALYKFTSKPYTKVNIEDCVHCNNIITTCSDLFEAIDDSNHKRHTFKEIPYKERQSKRKTMQAVA
jgi:hypothetical protein